MDWHYSTWQLILWLTTILLSKTWKYGYEEKKATIETFIMQTEKFNGASK